MNSSEVLTYMRSFLKRWCKLLRMASCFMSFDDEGMATTSKSTQSLTPTPFPTPLAWIQVGRTKGQTQLEMVEVATPVAAAAARDSMEDPSFFSDLVTDPKVAPNYVTFSVLNGERYFFSRRFLHKKPWTLGRRFIGISCHYCIDKKCVEVKGHTKISKALASLKTTKNLKIAENKT